MKLRPPFLAGRLICVTTSIQSLRQATATARRYQPAGVSYQRKH